MGLAMKIGIAVIRFAYDSDTLNNCVKTYSQQHSELHLPPRAPLLRRVGSSSCVSEYSTLYIMWLTETYVQLHCWHRSLYVGHTVIYIHELCNN
ncbi:hypothetical protein CVT25_003205 [Psilocybe cyanescens]|uniref:Uncharacterized protein n=1 Tax=Psilocybe cyanescens TaxID=93625 RepID=A0A409XEV7_PSICY|nr:hypothetical protein CVT25_003205 [Psilocybe cyanescens]